MGPVLSMGGLESLYLLLKFFHVTLAIVAVGFNASYGVWLARAMVTKPTL